MSESTTKTPAQKIIDAMLVAVMVAARGDLQFDGAGNIRREGELFAYIDDSDHEFKFTNFGHEMLLCWGECFERKLFKAYCKVCCPLSNTYIGQK